ncbi:MAG: hypothetical protein GEU91_16285 [Rhizobiales bacterium]|nr:hypothetical protein [Hyphomicrobiales bacterium]
MTNNLIRYEAPASDELHPYLYLAIIGLTLWLVLAAWTFFDDEPYTGLLLAVVTGFLFIFIALPAMLWLTWRRNHATANNEHRPPFRDWASREFATWQCRISGREAAVQVLLPIAALAIGMTAIGLVFTIVA